MVLQDEMARRYAETMLYWRGHLRAKEVQNYLGVSERTARTLIANWRIDGILPPYRRGATRHLVPVDGFDPGRPVNDPNAALALLAMADKVLGNPFGPVALAGGGHDLTLTAPVSSPATREILSACLDRQPVWLVYAAKTGRQEFVFHPSAVVRSRGRYHLRGFRAEGRDATQRPLADRFVDMVPARSIEARREDWKNFIALDNDVEWHIYDTREFVLSAELNPEERMCYAHEYGIAETGVLRVTQRRALIPYAIQELEQHLCWRHDGPSVPIWSEATPPADLPDEGGITANDID